MWWKSPGRGRTGTAKAAAPPRILHTSFYESEILSGSSGGFLTSIFPSKPCKLDAQGFQRYSSISTPQEGRWELGHERSPLGGEQRETSWMHFSNESIIRNHFFCWVIKISVEKKQGWIYHVLSNLKFSVERKCIWPLPCNSKHRGLSAIPEASITFGLLCVTPCEASLGSWMLLLPASADCFQQ